MDAQEKGLLGNKTTLTKGKSEKKKEKKRFNSLVSNKDFARRCWKKK